MPETFPAIDPKKLRLALVERDLPQWKLAARLDMDGTTFSLIVHGKRPMPEKFVGRVERLLGLEPGSLSAGEQRA